MLRMIESFDGVATYDQLVNGEYGGVEANAGKWRADAGTSAAFSLDASGRTGQCLRKLTSTNANVKMRTLSGGVTEVICGFAFKPGTLGASADGFFAIYDQAGTVVFRLNHTSATIQIQYGTTTTISTVFTTGSVLSTTRWDYIEVRYKMSDASAATEVRMNGAVLYSATSDNKLTASTSIAYVAFGVNGQNGTGGVDDRWDDFYCFDAAGSVNNTFAGDSKIRVARPDGNGNSSQFVGSDANSTDNYQLIDEQSRDPADYVESSADGDKDTYTFSAITAQGTIAGVQLVAHAAALNGGDPKDFNGIARLSATEITALLDLTTVMREAFCVFETKPGGGAWTATDVNNAEFGQSQVDA